MNRLALCGATAALLASVALGEERRPAWAFFLATPGSALLDEALPPKSRWTLPQSPLSYSRSQLENPLEPPDWYPQEHTPMPRIVAHRVAATPPRLPCALCHLPSGMGHAESAALAGLEAQYIEQQFAAWRSGERRMLVGGDASSAFHPREVGLYGP